MHHTVLESADPGSRSSERLDKICWMPIGPLRRGWQPGGRDGGGGGGGTVMDVERNAVPGRGSAEVSVLCWNVLAQCYVNQV
jgi:hypothetical protein